MRLTFIGLNTCDDSPRLLPWILSLVKGIVRNTGRTRDVANEFDRGLYDNRRKLEINDDERV